MTDWSPHNYQLRAIQLLVGQGSVGLFLDPGLGKTSISLAAFSILKEHGYVKKALIIAPLRPVYAVWPEEMKKWSDFHHITYSIIHGANKQEALEEDVDIYIINPEGLPWLYDMEKKRWKTHDFDVLVVDESTKFKDPSTKRFKLFKKHIPDFARRWILTGTPVPNGIMDLFGQIYVLDLGRALGKYITHYRMKYFHQGWNKYEWIPNQDAFQDIVEKIDPLIIRLKAEDYLEMPDYNVLPTTYVDLPPDVRKIYKDIEDDFITKLESGAIVAANAAVAGGKCRQIANGALYINDQHDWEEFHNTKLDALEDTLEELQGAPTLVMYEFNHDRERLLKRFGSATPVIGGGTSPRKADNYISRFNEGHIPVMFCHPASMAHGLNLQETCHHIIWFGIPWNLEYYDQSIRRIYRQGQKNPVFIYHIAARNTKDDDVLAVLKSKDRTQQILLSALARNNPV